jgi:hypothetical protein
MKYLIFIFLSVITVQSYSQEIIKPISKYTLNVNEIYLDSDGGTGEDLIKDFNQTLFNYFKLDSDYPTPLKKSLFKQSSEYKKLNDSFLKVKNDLKKLKYFSFQPTSKYGKSLTYNLSKSGFLVYINNHQPGLTHPYNTYDKLLFSNIVTQVINDQDWKNEYIFIPCNKKYGSLIESENSLTTVYIFFKPLNVVKKNVTLFGVSRLKDYLLIKVERIILTYGDEIVYNKTF